MYYYFYIQFEDEYADIYIVRVKTKCRIIDSNSQKIAEEKAKKVIMEGLVEVGNFKIKRLTLDFLLRNIAFIKDIAQLTVVTHP